MVTVMLSKFFRGPAGAFRTKSHNEFGHCMLSCEFFLFCAGILGEQGNSSIIYMTCKWQLLTHWGVANFFFVDFVMLLKKDKPTSKQAKYWQSKQNQKESSTNVCFV